MTAPETLPMPLTLAEGSLTPDDVTIELGDVVRGTAPGRSNPAQITLFNSVGLPIQDMAAARLVIDVARAHALGTPIKFTAAETATPCAEPSATVGPPPVPTRR
jgi:hypothetical protein